MAADLKAPAYRPPPPVYVFSWTGCYVGGNVGGLWVNKEFTDLRFNDRFFGQTFNADASSWAAGVQVGCNYQFAGGWVVGFQGDYDWTDAHTDRTVFFFDEFASFKVKSVGSVTGRVGYAWDRFLGYIKGGGAWERDELTFIFDNGAIGSLNNTRTGWTVGVGGELCVHQLAHRFRRVRLLRVWQGLGQLRLRTLGLRRRFRNCVPS
jgi:outer membrane immunogenic protein